MKTVTMLLVHVTTLLQVLSPDTIQASLHIAMAPVRLTNSVARSQHSYFLRLDDWEASGCLGPFPGTQLLWQSL